METTEKIVEAYVRYINHWATIPNIKCPGQYEIDLLAIDPKSGKKYHIESGVSIATGFSKLTLQKFDPDLLKARLHKSKQRRTLGYFMEHKFSQPTVLATLKTYGFEPGKYQRVIVSWGWEPRVEAEASRQNVLLWKFADVLSGIAEAFRAERTYFTDDTLRTLQLYAMASR